MGLEQENKDNNSKDIIIIDTESLWLGASSNTVVTIVSTYNLSNGEHKTYNLILGDKVEFKNSVIIGWNCELDITRLYSVISDDCRIINLKEVYIAMGKCSKYASLDSIVNSRDDSKMLRMKEYNNIRKKLHLKQPLTKDDFKLQTIKCITDVIATKELFLNINDDIDLNRFAKQKQRFYKPYLKYGMYGVSNPQSINNPI